MKNENSQAKSATVSTVRLVSGVECVRIGADRIEYFGSAAHVAVSYVVPTDRGPQFCAGWLPLCVWQASPLRS